MRTLFCVASVLLPALSFCQPADDNTPQPNPKRILGIIPNYRTSPSLTDYEPLTPREKFKLAGQDIFDRGTFALGAFFGAEALLTNSNPSFGHGAKGYARYFAASYADFAIGDFMTEAMYPTLLHQDPRYFRRGTGGGWSRFGHAMSQIFWTRKDSGGAQFNYSEIAGNATAVAISNAYYRDSRGVSDAATKLGAQIGVDMASNILKEFWPDIMRRFSRKHPVTPEVPSSSLRGRVISETLRQPEHPEAWMSGLPL